MSGDLVRTFVAVELPEETKSTLGKLVVRLSLEVTASLGVAAAAKALKWVDPTGIHITLKFLGSVPSSRLVGIEEALRRSAIGKRALRLELSDLGAFPSVRSPRVLWIGVRGQVDELARIKSQVDVELSKLGFPKETRAFSPHITLARLRETASPVERRKVGEAIAAEPQEMRIDIEVREISLMRSELTRAGARYSRITEIPLSRTVE